MDDLHGSPSQAAAAADVTSSVEHCEISPTLVRWLPKQHITGSMLIVQLATTTANVFCLLPLSLHSSRDKNDSCIHDYNTIQYNKIICIAHSGRLFSRIWGAGSRRAGRGGYMLWV